MPAPRPCRRWGLALASVQWLMLAGLAGVVWRLRHGGRAPRLHIDLAALSGDLRRILRLGGPIGGVAGALEIGVFVTAAAVVGLFGAAPLAAHQIAINFASITFMVPMGIGQAATVRVAAERGAGNPLAARRAAFVALGLGVGFTASSRRRRPGRCRTRSPALYVAVDDPGQPGAGRAPPCGSSSVFAGWFPGG